MLADGLAKAGIDMTLLHNVRNSCIFNLPDEAFPHSKYQVGSTTRPQDVAPAEKPE